MGGDVPTRHGCQPAGIISILLYTAAATGRLEPSEEPTPSSGRRGRGIGVDFISHRASQLGALVLFRMQFLGKGQTLCFVFVYLWFCVFYIYRKNYIRLSCK